MGLGINAFPAYVYIIFVYRVVYVDMSTRSSQLNHLSLESRVLSGPSRLDHNLYRFPVRNELIVIIKTVYRLVTHIAKSERSRVNISLYGISTCLR